MAAASATAPTTPRTPLPAGAWSYGGVQAAGGLVHGLVFVLALALIAQTGGARATGATVAVGMAVALVASLVLRRRQDQWAPHRTAAGAWSLATAVLVAATGILDRTTGVATVALLAAVYVATHVLRTLASPPLSAIAARIGGESKAEVQRVVGLGRSATQTGNLVGFGLASGLLVLRVPALGFALAALAALASAALAARLRPWSPAPIATAPTAQAAKPRASWSELPWPVLVAAFLAGVALQGVWNSVAPALVHPTAAFGGAEAVEALAAIGAGAAMALGLRRLGTWAFGPLAVAFAAFALAPNLTTSLPAVGALFALAGGLATVGLVVLSTSYRLAVPAERRASAMAAYSATAQASGLAGAGLVAAVGHVAPLAGVMAALLLAAAAVVAVGQRSGLAQAVSETQPPAAAQA